MTEPTDSDYQIAKQAIQTLILEAPVPQTQLATACRVTRQSLNAWLNDAALPKLPAFLRLKRAARQWSDYRLDRLDLPPGYALVAAELPEGWTSNRNALEEIARLQEALGQASGAVLSREHAQCYIDAMRRWLFALELELAAAAGGACPHGDGLPGEIITF